MLNREDPRIAVPIALFLLLALFFIFAFTMPAKNNLVVILPTKEFILAGAQEDDPKTAYIVRYVVNGQPHELDVYSEAERDDLLNHLNRLARR